MKTLAILLLFIGCTINTLSQGTDCSGAISIPLNGSTNNYSTSSTSGTNVLCAANGTTPITWFQFTTNASADCPLLNITASDGQACEVAMYTSCSGNMNNNLETGSSMCFDDGAGLWAPAHNYTLSANTTYYLRIKTTTATNLAISGENHIPTNNSCSGATDIDGNPLIDNNATHKPSSEITPPQLCAVSIENTAFYQYYVAATGTSVININNITCDNGAGNNIGGFQIGFFTGTCSNLTWMNPCFSGSGSFVQATTGILPAGTKVYVAVDGFEGSNCKYSIQAINAYTLSTSIKNFSAWKTTNTNVLKWNCNSKGIRHFELEKSTDGKTFFSLKTVTLNPENSDYAFEDNQPTEKTWYRIKQVMNSDAVELTKTIMVSRENLSQPVMNVFIESTTLHVNYKSDKAEKLNVSIINSYGQVLARFILNCEKGANLFSKNISNISQGNYYFILSNSKNQFSRGFIKLN